MRGENNNKSNIKKNKKTRSQEVWKDEGIRVISKHLVLTYSRVEVGLEMEKCRTNVYRLIPSLFWFSFSYRRIKLILIKINMPKAHSHIFQ